jgi:uncharacterized metal-binding protein
MNCTSCKDKKCRHDDSCGVELINKENIITNYLKPENQKIIQAAAKLVDNGKAGTLSRLDEIIEFIKTIGYKKIGLAYCYGMEKEAIKIKAYFKSKKINLTTISCTIGGIAQDEVNTQSCIHNVSCNPLGQAEQLNNENIDFVIIMGICLGHDILLQKNLKMDFTTFVVKDRLNNNNPLIGIK